MRKTKKPEWIKKAIRNQNARKRYFMKRYGNLDRMEVIEAKFQHMMDEWSFNDELKKMEDIK